LAVPRPSPSATHQLHQYHGPIADDAISCNLLAPTRCGPLAHFSPWPWPWPWPFPRGAAVAQGGHVCQVSSHRLNIATFFYTRRTTVSRACSVGSVDNKALHVPVTSGGIGRLHLLPIAYCLPMACLLLPTYYRTTSQPSLARPQRREPQPAYACSFWPPCFTMSRPETELWFAGSLISLSRPPIHGHHPHRACAS
jgi:hypothetical protein